MFIGVFGKALLQELMAPVTGKGHFRGVTDYEPNYHFDGSVMRWAILACFQPFYRTIY